MTADPRPGVTATAGPAALQDPLGCELALSAGPLLGQFNRAGVIGAAEVHVATRLAALAGETDEEVVLAAAMAVRGPRFGNVRVELGELRSTVVADVEGAETVTALPWPEPAAWIERVARSPLVEPGADGDARPLRLEGSALYLDRYWRDEISVAADIARRAAVEAPGVDHAALDASIARLFPGEPSDQRNAAAACATRLLAVIAGGPGTGKTTTIARVIAILHEQAEASGSRPPLIGLAAPTGKAAARMQDSIRAAARTMEPGGEVATRLARTEALTIHRLLRSRPDTSSRFRHDRRNPLPHDAVIIDETSMVALSTMARLLEAVRPDARLILVGDPEQLASVEAGAVLGDIVGPAADRPVRVEVPEAGGNSDPLPAGGVADRKGLWSNVVILTSNYRFSGPLAALADKIRRGDADGVVGLLESGGAAGLSWIPREAEADGPAGVRDAGLRSRVVAAYGALVETASAGDERAALDALAAFRVLCAHRRGPAGVAAWTATIERWLAEDVAGFDPNPAWYAGRPVMMTSNDYSIRLFNGDTGVAVAGGDGGLSAAFPRGAGISRFSPSRLPGAETVYAMTVHKAQGSEFDRVVLMMPPAGSRLLTRELLYTAVTRTRSELVLVGSEESLRSATERRVSRASGLTERLWGPPAA